MSEDIQSTSEFVPSHDIQARREARRRKILENAKDRLEKLNGRTLTTDDNKILDGHTKITTQRTFSDPEIETEELFGPKFPIINSNIPHSFEDNIFGGNSSNAEAELENLMQFFSQINQLPSQPTSQQQGNGLFNPMMEEQNMQRQSESKLVRFLKTKVHLFIISCITYILFSSGREYFTKYSVFLPLLIWELTETFLLKTNENNKNVLFSIAFMMGGISPNISNGLLKIIGTLNKILKDVGVFIFFFVFCHIVCTFDLTSQIGT